VTDSAKPEPESSLPQGFTTLGYGGVLPFAAGALGIALLEGDLRLVATRALLAYGAVILSFLGAVHWGLLLRRPDPRIASRLLFGVLPALAGWIALLLPARLGLAVLVAAFGAFWLYEHRVLPDGWLPAAYLRLRRNLSLAVCSLLALGLIALD
jgi:hypothetical protein